MRVWKKLKHFGTLNVISASKWLTWIMSEKMDELPKKATVKLNVVGCAIQIKNKYIFCCFEF